MTEENTDRVDYRLPVGIPINPTIPVQVRGISMDRQGVEQAETPSSLVAAPGEQGVRTEWDAGSLDSAITWLESHANYLWRLSHNMADIKELLGSGGPGADNPFGGFSNATELSTRHNGVYTTTETNLRQLSDNLYSAADALRRVKRDYEDAEGANSMTAQEMTQALSEAARNNAGSSDE